MVSAPFDNEQYRNQGNKAIGKPNCYQKVIICAGCPIFVYGGAISALPGAFSLVIHDFIACGQIDLPGDLLLQSGVQPDIPNTTIAALCPDCLCDQLCHAHPGKFAPHASQRLLFQPDRS